MAFGPIKSIRTNIMAGVFLLLPLVTTAYVFFKLFKLIDDFLPNLLSTLIPFIRPDWVPGIGLLLTLLVAYFVGIAAKNYIGGLIIQTGNAIISNIPMLNKIYLGVQQVVDSVAGHKKGLFDRPVLIEYPKKDSYCIAFVTSETSGEIPKKTGRELLSLFVPTTPNPTSGFLLFLPRSEITELDMSVETAVKTVMSAGMVNPDHIRKTNHMYSIPKQLKNWNWLRIFNRGDKDSIPDPRD